MTLGVSNVGRIRFGFEFSVNPDPIIECALKAKFHYASWFGVASVMEFGFKRCVC